MIFFTPDQRLARLRAQLAASKPIIGGGARMAQVRAFIHMIGRSVL